MTEQTQTIISLLGAFATTISSVAALVSSLRNHEKIIKIEAAANGMQAALVVAAKAEGHAAGVAEEKNATKAIHNL